MASGPGLLWAPGGLGVFDPGINAFSILTAILPCALIVTHAELEVPANAHTPIAARLVLRSGGAAIEVELDFRRGGTPSWDIMLETRCGHRLVLANGGARLTIDEAPPQEATKQEYAGLYARFASLIAAGKGDADAAPLRLVADALLIAETRTAPPFVD